MSRTSPFDALLQQCRDLAFERLAAAGSAVLGGADEFISGQIDKTQDQDTQALLMDTRDLVGRRGGELEREFQDRYSEEFEKCCRKVRKALESDSDEGEALELELVGEEELNETLKFKDLATKLRRACEGHLGALDQRTAVLLGDANLQSDDNPFGPRAICEAYKQACRAVSPDVRVRLVLLRVLEEHGAEAFNEMYGELNDLLVENSILPKIKYGVKKTEGGRVPGSPEEEEEDAEDDEEKAAARKAAEAATPQDFFSAIQKLMGGAVPQPGAPGTPGGPPALQGTELSSALTRLQVGDASGITSGTISVAPGGHPGNVNVLKEIKATNVGASLGSVDAMTLDVVSMLFDELFDDPKVPAGVKALAGRLQIPMLKIALADKTLFSRKDHPARVLLDILGEFAARLPADFDEKHALHPRLEPILREVVEKFEDKVEIFIAANDKLRALVAEEDAKAAEASKAETARQQQLENLSVGRTAAQEEIRTRLVERRPPRAVRGFLVHQWIKVLLVTHAQTGKDSPPWGESLKTMDELITSVEPKPTIPERRALATQVPGLLKRITMGLNSVGVEDSIRTAFYSDLMKLHQAAISLDAAKAAKPDAHSTATRSPEATATRAPETTATRSPRDATSTATRSPTSTATRAPSDAAATATRSPMAAAAKGAAPPKAVDEDLDFTAEITVKNPFGGGEVKVDELDFTEAAPAIAEPAARPSPKAAPKKPAKELALPSKLKEGVWVGMRAESPDEPRVPLKLLYMSPLKSRFLFCNRAGKTVLECNRADLAKRFRLRDMIILSEAPDTSLFERFIRGVMGKLGGAPAQ